MFLMEVEPNMFPWRFAFVIQDAMVKVPAFTSGTQK